MLEKVLSSNHRSVRRRIFEASYTRRHCKTAKKRRRRGFPGMLGSLDCMHWAWKNCPTAWAGHYSGRHGGPTIILEAVASYDLWIWHAYFGLPGSNNDINVLQSSNLFDELAQGKLLLLIIQS
ncbi:putative nuclease HARBI1 [Iris pallida]|uniref:Nuclease HARBI1 n=1 Tax=Iris pallida TaxID=29817 RepID=A0AAX6G7B1_IRIPA|nr:putative nuclease HARBI1 [Iris pallida]